MTLNEFKQLVDDQLPDNTEHLITADRLRAVLKAMAEVVADGGFD